MKRILVTGVNSYIGNSFRTYIEQFADGYQVDSISVRGNDWRSMDFSSYDHIFHVSGIAHQKETKNNAHLYYEVNRELTIEIAKKAKSEGVKQFIFLSSMSVYGLDTGVITKDTTPKPKSNYGKSKLQAEDGLKKLADGIFKVCILRPPMVYGKNCKGNFQTVVKLIEKFPAFPKIKNQRSMLYIGNLCSFIKLCVDQGFAGLFIPQNKEYVMTSEMAEIIADALGKKIYLSRLLGCFVSILRLFVPIAKKAFGNLIFINTENNEFRYCMKQFSASVQDSI